MFFNHIKTAFLLAALSGLFMLLGGFIGGANGVKIALIMSLLMNGITYFLSDRIVLRMYGAQPLDSQKYRWIYAIVSSLSHEMKLPMPKLWLIHTPMANAFATGRSPNHSSVAVTTGILDLLDERELRGVLGHELSHIKNRDMLVTTIAATIATSIGYLAHMLQYAAFWSSSRENNRQRGNPIAMIVVAILIPIAASLIQLAISRSREYLADESGAECTQDPMALANALTKLHTHIPHAHLDNRDTEKASTAPLFIVHPFTTDTWTTLFSTHPPMHKRIERLRAMKEKHFHSR